MEYRLSMPDVRWRVCERLLDGIDFTNIESCWCIIVLTLSLLPDVNSGAGYSNKSVWFRDFSELPSTKIQILEELAVRPYYSVYVLMHRASPKQYWKKIWKISQARIQYLQELDMPDSNFEEEKKRDPSRLLTDHKSLGLLIGCNFCPDSVGKRFDHCLYSVSLWITLLPPVRESYAHESPEQLSLQQREISLEFLLLEPSFFLSETLRDIMLPKAQARRKSFSTPWTSSLATCAMRTSKR